MVEIAYRHLTENSKSKLLKSSEISRSPIGQITLILSNRSESYKNTSSWHYLDFPENLNRNQFDDFLNQSTDKNLYKRTLELIDQLKNREDYSNEEQIVALYFLVHLIGDAHQPLHLGREEDLGGNKIKVKWFGQPTNLHSLWDDELVDFQKYSYTEYAAVLDFHDSDFNRNLTDGNLEDWLLIPIRSLQRFIRVSQTATNSNTDTITIMLNCLSVSC